MSETSIRRLTPNDARAIVACFERVYGHTYANEIFYDASTLRSALLDGRIGSVGAVKDGSIVAHMAMTVHSSESMYIELGNTVVDPTARGEGLAWQVGAALTDWCIELG